MSFHSLLVGVFQPSSKMLKEPKGITTQKCWSIFQNWINKMAHLLESHALEVINARALLGISFTCLSNLQKYTNIYKRQPTIFTHL